MLFQFASLYLYLLVNVDGSANQWTGFYMITASVMKGLRVSNTTETAHKK